MQALLVGIGGFVGAIARFAVSKLTQLLYGGSFPIHTLFVNVVGCFLLGLFVSRSVQRGWPSSYSLFFAVGFIGALTTFSAFAAEASYLWQGGKPFLASLFIFGNLVFGFLVFWASQR